MSTPVVLLAARNPELRRRLFTQLLCQGYDVIDAPTTVEVLRAVRHRRGVDLFIMDVSLDTPGDGVELARFFRHCERRPRVILLAGKEPQCWATDAYAAGVTAYFAHPFSCDDILVCVHKVCSLSSSDMTQNTARVLGSSSPSPN